MSDKKLDAILDAVTRLEGRFNNLDQRLNIFDSRLTNIEHRLITIEDSIRKIADWLPLDNTDIIPKRKKELVG